MWNRVLNRGVVPTLVVRGTWVGRGHHNAAATAMAMVTATATATVRAKIETRGVEGVRRLHEGLGLGLGLGLGGSQTA